jgi:hypothetical protein
MLVAVEPPLKKQKTSLVDRKATETKTSEKHPPRKRQRDNITTIKAVTSYFKSELKSALSNFDNLASLEENHESMVVTVRVKESLTVKSSSLIVQACEKVAGVTVEDDSRQPLQLSLHLPDQMSSMEISYGESVSTTLPSSSSNWNEGLSSSTPASTTLSSSNVCEAPSSPSDMSTVPVVSVSNDELLFARAVLSLCDEQAPITVQFRPRKFIQGKCVTSALAFLSVLQEHHFSWYFHPSQVIEKLSESNIGESVPSPIDDTIDTTLEQVRRVLLPVTVHLHSSHHKNISRSKTQQGIVKKKEEDLTPQELETRRESKVKTAAKSASLGCLHSAEGLVEVLKAMFRVTQWNRSVDHASTQVKLPFRQRMVDNRTTFGDMYMHYAFDSPPGSDVVVGDTKSCSQRSEPPGAQSESKALSTSPQLKNPPRRSSRRRTKPQSLAPSPTVSAVDLKSHVPSTVNYLVTTDCNSVINLRKGALKAHDTRESKGRSSSPIDVSLWEVVNVGGLQMSGLPMSIFRTQTSLSRVPLTTDRSSLRLMTNGPRDVVSGLDVKKIVDVTTLGQLGQSQRTVDITGISYKFASSAKRQRIRFKSKGIQINLRPSEPRSSSSTKVSGG